MRYVNRKDTSVISSVMTVNHDYVPKGYYNYPELQKCIGFEELKVTYTRNHMFITVLPHKVKLVRRIHTGDKEKYPDGKTLMSALNNRLGKDLAYILNELDVNEEEPKVSIFKYIMRKVIDWVDKI